MSSNINKVDSGFGSRLTLFLVGCFMSNSSNDVSCGGSLRLGWCSTGELPFMLVLKVSRENCEKTRLPATALVDSELYRAYEYLLGELDTFV